MLLKSISKHEKISSVALKAITIPIGILLLMGNSAANARSLDTKTESQWRSTSQIAQVKPSNVTQPPDVIVDPRPDRTPRRTRNRTRETLNTEKDPRFTCERYEGQYTVMYRPQSQPDRAYPWAIPGRLGGGWTPENRCFEIARRLESYRPDGLDELQIGYENGYNTLCVTSTQIPNCRIVLTVPPGRDSEIVRDRVFENLLLASDGQITQGVNTFTSQNNGFSSRLNELLNGGNNSNRSRDINLRPFLDSFDGGTGTQLRPDNTRSRKKYQLNRIFR